MSAQTTLEAINQRLNNNLTLPCRCTVANHQQGFLPKNWTELGDAQRLRYVENHPEVIVVDELGNAPQGAEVTHVGTIYVVSQRVTRSSQDNSVVSVGSYRTRQNNPPAE